MDSLSGSAYRPNPDQWHWELRTFFLYYLVREDRYRKAIDALVPYWQRVLESRPDLDPQASYYELPVPSPSEDIDIGDPLLQYLVFVQECVSKELRCRVDGHPASWVCYAVHASVNGTALDLGVRPTHWTWVGELLIPVLSTGSAFTVRRINGHPFSDQSLVEEQTIEEPHPGTPFSQWKKLKKQAHQELDVLLNELRAEVENKTGDWPRMYQKGRETRTQVTMKKLVRWLVGREDMFLGDRSATNDLLHELALDPPGPSEKIDEN
jgi:hypothetical protein